MNAGVESGILALLEGVPPEDALSALASVKARLYFRELQRAHLLPDQKAAAKMLTVKETAALLGLSEKAIYARAATLGAVRFGRALRIPEARVRHVVANGWP